MRPQTYHIVDSISESLKCGLRGFDRPPAPLEGCGCADIILFAILSVIEEIRL